MADWQAVAANVGGALAALAAAYTAYQAKRESQQATREARAAKNNAGRAADFAEPTGNGFADEVRGRLGEIKADQEDSAAHLIRMDRKLDQVEHKIDQHIGDHASADVRRRRDGN